MPLNTLLLLSSAQLPGSSHVLRLNLVCLRSAGLHVSYQLPCRPRPLPPLWVRPQDIRLSSPPSCLPLSEYILTSCSGHLNRSHVHARPSNGLCNHLSLSWQTLDPPQPGGLLVNLMFLVSSAGPSLPSCTQHPSGSRFPAQRTCS